MDRIQIFEDVSGTAERWLGVNHPLGLPCRSQILGEGARILKRFKRVEEAELPDVKGALQLRQKQPAKEPREHTHQEEESRPVSDPALAVGAQTAARDHAMQMRAHCGLDQPTA